jgi:phosphoglycerol transferase MdoB-like AlkP superfamily enzyme
VIAAASLFLVLVLAKLLVIGFASPWLFVQDAVVAAVFAAAELALRRRLSIWMPYAVAVAWIAINVPVALVLGSWLTWPMLHAAGGPLSDSIRYYLTPVNLLPLAVVIGAGAALPLVMRRKASAGIIAAVMVAAVCGATAKARSTEGFDRNAITVLFPSGAAGGGVANHSALRESAIANPQVQTNPLIRTNPLIHTNLEDLRSSAKGMNVVVVILESTAAQYLGLYGAADDPMPNLSSLAANSVVFDAAYAVYPESVKGLYATLCARRPRMGAPLSASLDDPCVPLPKSLGAAGYRTALFHSGRFGYLGMDELVKRSGFDVAEDAGAIGGVVRSSFGVDEASTARRMIDWIRKADDARPFFAMYMPAAGHHPYASAIRGPFRGEAEFDHYRNALHETDLAIAQLVSALHTPTIINPTILIVIGDHGEAFGQHGGNAGHTLAVWEENVHVPMVVSIPGVTRGQMRVQSPASVLDVAPTLLDLIGAAPRVDADGISLLTTRALMAPFFADYSLNWMGVRDGCWKLLCEKNDERTLLFNVCRDPAEASDVARDFQSIHDELVKRVEQFFAVRIRPRRVPA